MKFKVTLIKEFEGKDVEDCCGNLMKYLHRCVFGCKCLRF